MLFVIPMFGFQVAEEVFIFTSLISNKHMKAISNDMQLDIWMASYIVNYEIIKLNFAIDFIHLKEKGSTFTPIR